MNSKDRTALEVSAEKQKTGSVEFRGKMETRKSYSGGEEELMVKTSQKNLKFPNASIRSLLCSTRSSLSSGWKGL